MSNVGLPQSPQNQPAESPIMGLFLDRPAHMIDPKGFQACNNVRIELGRVRSDLIGWMAFTLTAGPAFNGPIIWLDTIVNSIHAQVLVVTPTDIFQVVFNTGAATYTTTYATPAYVTGLASVNNGSTSVSGSSGTHWAGDITGGSQTCQTTGTIAAGSTSLTINLTGSNQFLLNVLVGMPITDTTQPGAIPLGTYVNSVTQTGGPTLTLGLSQATLLSIPATDSIFLGSGQTVRPNVRANDQIGFGTTNPNAVTTWYTVASVSADGTGGSAGTSTLTLTTPYVGANLTNSIYVIRQCFTNTTTGANPYIPECSSDNLQFPGGFNGGTAFQCNVAWFFTNGVDPVYVFFNDFNGPFSGINIFQYARSIPFVCASLKQFKGIMIYGGLSFNGGLANGGQTLGSSIASSDSNLPLQLNSGIAFQGITTSGPFLITRIAILGSSLLLYSRGSYSGGVVAENDEAGSVTSASLVGFPTIWTFSDVVQTRGPVSGGAVAIFPDRHEFLAIDGQYRYNGLFVQVMNDHIWRATMKQFDFTRLTSTFASIVPTFGDVLWAIPQLTDPAQQLYPSTAYVEHYMEQANSYLFKPYTKRDFPFTTMGSLQNVNFNPGFVDVTSQPFYIAGDINGNLWQLYVSNTQNGVAPTCSVQWGSRPIGNGRNRVLVTRVYPEIEYIAGGGSISVTLTMQDAAAGPIKITDTQTFNPNYANNIYFTTHYRRGRQAAVTISDSSGLGWICQGYDWDYMTGGVRP